VLFPEITDRDRSPFRVEDGYAEDAFRQKNSFAVMAKRAMPKVREEGFRFIEPPVDLKIIFELAPEFPGAALGVLKWVRHR
jgi:hypothetical protein